MITMTTMKNSSEWWEKGKLLGVGAYGMMSEARPFSNSPISRLLPPLMAVKSSQNSLFSERRMLLIFKNHPNIIGYYGNEISTATTDQGIDIPIYNIFLEYASDGCLADEIEKTHGEGLSEKKVSEYLKGMLLGLNEIHKVGVIHCDIKPDNILIANGVPKIADFGLAIDSARIVLEHRGTPEYMAPEAIRHGVYTSAADIWSLGCTVLTMLTGENVWGAPFGPELMRFIGAYDVVPKMPNSLSMEARDFLEQCLVMDYRRRWSAQSLLNHPFLLNPENKIVKVKKMSYLAALKKGLE